jgi:glycolate oxidase iron-sulfur subunit
MQTQFSASQLQNPATAESEAVIRKCVHCGFCTATCPTYALLGDELDSPRGRIYMIKDMLENERVPSAETVKHVDRCLSCLSCMTTCPSGVNYMHLVDHARAYIEEKYDRPLGQRIVRRMLALIVPVPARFRMAIRLAALARPFERLIGRYQSLRHLSAMLRLAPRKLPRPVKMASKPQTDTRGRVILLKGCVEPVLRPEFQGATTRLLTRMGYEAVFANGEQCCGALVHHLGRETDSLASAKRNVDAWIHEIDKGDLSAIIVTASGCGTTIKDYGFMLRQDPEYAEKAALVSSLAQDISEFLSECDVPTGNGHGLTIAYHAACSLQHGQQVTDAPKGLLQRAGFNVVTPAESHLCCGSAGVYNIMQPDIANQLGDRKAHELKRLNADAIATGNIGCAVQIGERLHTPVVHTVELLDWATGGPKPSALR